MQPLKAGEPYHALYVDGHGWAAVRAREETK
jgi:hypothetical protein